MQHAAETLGVECAVCGRQAFFGRCVLGTARLAPFSWGPVISRHGVGQQDPSSRRSLRSRATAHEYRDCPEDIDGRIQERAVYAKGATAVTHHHRAIAREAQRRHAAEAVGDEALQKRCGLYR
jgi:hypothetical protein